MARKSQRLRRQQRIERMKAREQEAKMAKVVEDNSVILERMKNVSSTCDTILQTFNTTEDNEVDTPDEIDVRAPMIKVAQPPPEIKETPLETPNFKRMTKRNLIKFAKENNIKVTPTMTKANIIKTIEAKQ